MRLVIAEKPSVAQSLAAVLGARQRREARQGFCGKQALCQPRRAYRAQPPQSGGTWRGGNQKQRARACREERQQPICRRGGLGFRGSKKSTPFAAQTAAETAARAAMEHGLKTVEVFVKGPAEQISQLETGAVSAAEAALQMDEENRRQFFLVGYTVAQYRLDRYPLSTLLGHGGKTMEADVVATFLPRLR